jgi:hypothetical protein
MSIKALALLGLLGVARRRRSQIGRPGKASGCSLRGKESCVK